MSQVPTFDSWVVDFEQDRVYESVDSVVTPRVGSPITSARVSQHIDSAPEGVEDDSVVSLADISLLIDQLQIT